MPIHITAGPPYRLDLARAGDIHVAYGLCVPLQAIKLAPSPLPCATSLLIFLQMT